MSYNGLYQAEDCPKCKSKQGWQERSVNLHYQDYTPEGEADNCEVIFKGGGVEKYCANCGRKITRLIKEQV